MDKKRIKQFLDKHADNKDRTLVVIDFSNVEKWKQSLGWEIGIRELGNLTKSFAGKKFLRRFYYGSDYGPKESSTTLLTWSDSMLTKAKMNNFELVTKRVKYMPSNTNPHGFDVKCDLDVEMAVDMIRERDAYDTIILFSGDGDLSCVLRYLHDTYDKRCYVFGARDHFGREIVDLKREKIVKEMFYAEDFEYRLNFRR
jgi:uncharacterized LabA/DUF88 family protein